MLNFNEASLESDWVERPACELPSGFKSLAVKVESSLMTTLIWRQPLDAGACLTLSYRVWVDDGQAGSFVQYGS